MANELVDGNFHWNLRVDMMLEVWHLVDLAQGAVIKWLIVHLAGMTVRAHSSPISLIVLKLVTTLMATLIWHAVAL